MSLTRAGFQVTEADDGIPAIELSRGASFEVIVVDFNMKSQLTGADVVRHYKQQFGKGIYCVVLSGEDSEDTRACCLDAGADDVLLKPCSPVQLRRKLTDAVQRNAAA